MTTFMLFACNNNEINCSQTPFEWEDEISNGLLQEKTAMLVPVYLGTAKFYMQFDLGADVSMLYLEEIPSQLHTMLFQHIKHKQYEYEDYQKVKLPKAFQIQFLNKTIAMDSIHIMNYQIDSSLFAATTSIGNMKIIGTFGRDLFKENCEIDYKNSHLIFDQPLLKKKPQQKTISIEIYDDYLIFIPIHINNTKYWVLFDTGSSMFSLLITKEALPIFKLSKKDFTGVMAINVWGKSENSFLQK